MYQKSVLRTGSSMLIIIIIIIIIIMKILESAFEGAREEAAILSRTRAQRAVAFVQL